MRSPTPWTIHPGERGTFYILAADGSAVCRTYEPSQSMLRMAGSVDPQANVALIVAAVNTFTKEPTG